MKTSYRLVLGVLTASALQAAACSSDFNSCEDSRTCSGSVGGTAGSDAAGGAADSAAGAGESAGGLTEPAGGVGNTAGRAGNGGADNGGIDNGGADNGGADDGAAVDCDPKLDACGGSCVDLDADAKHCGACGHDCLGGQCTLGVCQPIEIAKSQGRVLIVAVDDQFIYWAGDAAVVGKKSIDNSGQSTVLVPASAGEPAYYGAIVGQTFYWANDWRDNGVRGCLLPSCAGGPSLLIPGTAPPDGLVYSAHVATLYWSQGASLWHQVLPSGPVEQFIPTTFAPTTLASDDSFVYWVEHDSTAQSAEVRKVPLEGGTSSSLVTGLKNVEDMTPYGKSLFVLIAPITGGASIGSIALPNGIGSASPKPFAPAGDSARKVRVDESGVYWTQRDGVNGSIRHCPLTGCSGDAEILAPSTAPWALTTDSKAIYRGTEDGFVMKLAK